MFTSKSNVAEQLELFPDFEVAHNYSINREQEAGMRRLVSAIVLNAINDALKGSEEDRQWLLCHDCELYMSYLNLPHPKVIEWVKKGCPNLGEHNRLRSLRTKTRPV